MIRADKQQKETLQKRKEQVDASVARADEERGVAILLTGNGMVMRSLGYGYKVGIIQFIKGKQLSDEGMFLSAIRKRPAERSLVITGRGGGEKLRELVDTVSEVQEIKHAFKAGVKARKGVDY